MAESDPTTEFGKKLFGGKKPLVEYRMSKAARKTDIPVRKSDGTASNTNMVMQERLYRRRMQEDMNRINDLLSAEHTISKLNRNEKVAINRLTKRRMETMEDVRQVEAKLDVKRHKEIVKLLKQMLKAEQMQVSSMTGGGMYGNILPGGRGGRKPPKPGRGGRGGRMGRIDPMGAAMGGMMAADAAGGVGGKNTKPAATRNIPKPRAGGGGARGGMLRAGGNLLKGGLGVMGGLLGVVAINDGMNSIRGKRDEPFILDEADGGFMNSKAMDYLTNTGAGALSGAALGSLVFPGVGTAIGAAVGGAIGLGGSLYADFEEAINGFFAMVGDFIKNADWKDIGRQIGKMLQMLVGMIVDGIKQLPGIIWEGMKGIFNFMVEWGPEILGAAFDLVVGIFSGLFDGVVEAGAQFFKDLPGHLANFGGWISGGLAGMWQNFSDWIGGIWNAAMDWLPWSDKNSADNLVKDYMEGKTNINLADKNSNVLMSAYTKAMETKKEADIGYETSLQKYNSHLMLYGADSDITKNSKITVDAYAKTSAGATRAVHSISDQLNSMGITVPGVGIAANKAATPAMTSATLAQPPAISTASTVTGNNKPNATPEQVASAKSTIMQAASITGIDSAFMLAMANRESSFDADVVNERSKATGLFQFVGSTWDTMYAKYGKQYGLVNDRTDPRSNAIMAGLLTKDNTATLTSLLGRAPTNEELYLAHFAGPSTAAKIIRGNEANPNSIVDGISQKFIDNNPTIFTPGASYAKIYRSLTHDMNDDAIGQWASVSPVPPVVPNAATPSSRNESVVYVERAPENKPQGQSIPSARPPYRPPDDIPMGGDDVAVAAMNSLRGV